jgi:hypothetical protein
MVGAVGPGGLGLDQEPIAWSREAPYAFPP